MSGVPQGSVFESIFFILYTSELFHILETTLLGYADNSNLMAAVPYQGVRVAVGEFLIRDFGRVCEYCDLW